MNTIPSPASTVQPTARVCPRCGAVLGGFGPEGLCPACLLRGGLEAAEEAPAREGGANVFQPRRFGDYELLEEIARGGMGVIYKARQVKLNRTVALKLILSGQHASVAELARFRAEAETAARLQHPNIVAIHEVGECEGQPFFSMDFVTGQNLAQLVGNTPLQAQRAAKYMLQIARAVHYAHQQGVLHRDLKPSNVLIDAATDQPQVTDFGLAKRLEGDASLTITGQVLGSPGFMPPEQATGKQDEIGAASDVYSLGAMLYHLLTGRPPFVADTVPATLRMVLEMEAVSPRMLNASTPRDLETICLKCLEKEAARRYATAQILAEELERFLRDEPIQARPASKLEKAWRWCRRNRALAVVSGIVLALLLTVAMGSFIAAIRIDVERTKAEANAKAEQRERERAEKLAEESRVNLYAARIKVAQQTFKEGDITHALDVLESVVPQSGQTDLRSFDWHYLMQLCHSEQMTLNHEKRVNAVAFSPDGRLLATTGESGIIHLWNTTNGNLQAQLIGHTGVVGCVTFAPDGKTLATVGSDGVLRIWESPNWRQLRALPLGTNSLTALSYSPDGTRIAIGEGEVPNNAGNPMTRYSPQGTTGRIILLDSKTLELLFATQGHKGGVRALRFSANGSTIFSGGVDRSVRRIDSSTGDVLTVQTNFSGPVFDIGLVSQDSELVAISWFPYHETGEIKILDAATLAEKRILGVNAGRITKLTVSPEGKRIATAGVDNTARLWDAATGEEVMTIHGHIAAIFGLAFNPTGELLATGGWDSMVKLWDLKTDPVRQRISSPQTYSVSFSPDGKLLACSGTQVELRNADTGDLIASFPEFKSADVKVKFTADGRTLVAAGSDGVAVVFDVPTRKFRRTFKIHDSRIWGLALGPDGKTFITAGGAPDPTVKLWNADSVAPVKTFVGHSNSVQGAAFALEGRWLISGNWTETRVWDPSSGGLLKTVPGVAIRLTVSPDGKMIAAGGSRRSILLRDAATLNKTATLTGHKDEVYELAFSHDNKLLASASWDGTVKLWQVASGQELLTIPSKAGVVWCVEFSPDDRTLVFGCGSNIKGSGVLTILRTGSGSANSVLR